MTLWVLVLAIISASELTVPQMLLAAVGALSSVVGVLFVYLRSIDAKQEKKLNDCEQDRRELWIAVIELGGKRPHPRRL